MAILLIMRTLRMDVFTFIHSRKACMAFFHRLRTTQEIVFVHSFHKSLQKQAGGCFGGLEGVGGIESQIFLPISKKSLQHCWC